MPASKSRKTADEKAAAKRRAAGGTTARTPKQPTLESPGWVAPLFVTVGLLGVIWLVLYYLAGAVIPGMAALGAWNVLIGMGLMIASFAIATQWK